MKTARLGTFLIALALVPAALCASEAVDVLRRADDADRHVSYRGTKVATISFGGPPANAVLKVIHLRPDRTRIQFFSPDALAGIIMIRDGNDAWKFLPREQVWEKTRSGRTHTPGQFRSDAFLNYDVRIVGTEQVAGRMAYVVRAMPRNEGEPAHVMWVDREFFLVIGTQVENPSGTIVRSSKYTNIQLNPPDISPTLFQVKGKVRQSLRKPDCPKLNVLKPTYLPVGYRLIGSSSLNMRGCGCSHLQFSNGVTIISLFEQKSKHQAPPTPVASKVTNVITWARGGTQFTLMGDIPRSELQKIADSIR